MLVAVASFVLHGAAMAGFHPHGAGRTQCQPQSDAAARNHAAHQHADGVVHVHSAEAVDVTKGAQRVCSR